MQLTIDLFKRLKEQADKDNAIVVLEDGALANAHPLGWLGRIKDEILNGEDAESAGLLSSFLKQNLPAIKEVVLSQIKHGDITPEQASTLTIELLAMIAYKVCNEASKNV